MVEWTSSYDKYVNPNGGSDGNNGDSKNTAYATCAKAAASANNYSRIHLAPGAHTITSPVTYEDKKLQWIGPQIAGGMYGSAPVGSAYITGSGLARYFDARPSDGSSPSNLYGGGFHNLVFNMNGINVGGEAIRIRQGNYMQLSNLHGFATSGTFRANYIIHDSESQYAVNADSQDRSWWTIRGVHAFNCAVMLRSYPSRGSRGANGWLAENIHGDTDDPTGATIPYWENEQRTHFRMVMEGGSFGNNATNVPCIKIDGRLSTANPNFSMVGVTFHDMKSPYYGLQIYHAHVALLFGGSNGTTGGKLRLEADTDGFVAAPAGSVSLAESWPDYPWKNGDGTF